MTRIYSPSSPVNYESRQNVISSDLILMQFRRVWCKSCMLLPGGPDTPGGPDFPGGPADHCMERRGKKTMWKEDEII